MKLFKDYSNDFSIIREEIRNNRKLIMELKGEVAELKNEFSKLKEAADTINKEDETTDPIVTEKPTVTFHYSNMKIPASKCKDFKYEEIDKDSFKFRFRSETKNRYYYSSFTIFDVIILSELETENVWTSWKDLERFTGLKSAVICKIAYNLKIGFFDSFIADHTLDYSKEYGLLYINGKKTKVPIKTVRYICSCMANSTTPATTLLKLEKAGECSTFMYRLIGTHFGELYSLVEDKTVEFENNPEKRKEKYL